MVCVDEPSTLECDNMGMSFLTINELHLRIDLSDGSS